MIRPMSPEPRIATRRAGEVPGDVDELLGEAGRHDARRARAGDPDRLAGPFARAHRQHHRAGVDRRQRVVLRQQRHAPAGVDVEHVGVGQHVDAALEHLLQEALGVLGPGELLLEVVQAEAVVDALLQDAAGLALAVDDQHVLGAGVAGADGGREPGGAAADDHDVVAAAQARGAGLAMATSRASALRPSHRAARARSTTRRPSW
jgi:hypothetical protein